MKLEEEQPRTPEERKRQRQIYTLLLVALLGAIVAGLLLASSIWGWKRDAAPPKAVESEAAAIDPDEACAAQSTYDGIKMELFRRAAQTRGNNQGAMTRVADFSLLRVQGPYLRGVDDQTKRIDCAGIAMLQLPPQITTEDGTGTLSASIDYSVQPSADGTGNVVNVGNADSITVALATIHGIAPSGPAPQLPQATSDLLPEEPTLSTPDSLPADDNRDSSIQAGFDCSKARSRSEEAVCSNAGLAALDRQMNAQFSSAMNSADDDQRQLLESTRSRFLAYRNRCSTDQCIADAYRGRIREIRDVMNNDWQEPR